MSLRRLSILGLLVLALTGGAVAAYWHWSAARLADWIATWSAQQRAQGYEMTYRGPEIAGFPFALIARFESPEVASPKGWRWSAPELTGRAWLWDPLDIRLDLSGSHRFAGSATSSSTPLEIYAMEAWARLLIDRMGQVARGRLEGHALRLNPGEGEVTIGRLHAEAGPYDPGSDGQPQSIAFAIELSALSLPPGRRDPFGRDLQRLAIAATLFGPIEGEEPGAVLRRWRQEKGRLAFERIEIVWGALDTLAQGDLTLDAAFRPQGAFETRTRNPAAVIDRLATLGLIQRGQAATANLAVLALPREADGQGATRVLLPVTLRDGLIYLGPAPMARLRPLL